eukprot:3717941-Amphidinium_carterae.1
MAGYFCRAVLGWSRSTGRLHAGCCIEFSGYFPKKWRLQHISMPPARRTKTTQIPISAIHALLERGSAPYDDFAVWVPYTNRAHKKTKLSSFPPQVFCVPSSCMVLLVSNPGKRATPSSRL